MEIIKKSIYIKDCLKDLNHPNIECGEYTYGSIKTVEGVFPESPYKLKIGKFCSIAEGTEFLMHVGHTADFVSTYPFAGIMTGDKKKWPECPPMSRLDYITAKGDITVGNDVWLGKYTMVLSGVTIGDGAIIGARSTVTRDIPPYAVAVGSPAKVVSYRFSPGKIARLLAIKWWDWPEEKIRENLPLMCGTDIGAFVDKHYTPEHSCQN